VTRNPLVTDVIVAVVIVALVLIIEPGVAVAAILALIVLAVCGISYVVGRSRRRSHRYDARRRGSTAPAVAPSRRSRRR
jgi:hypothetical protein